MRLVEDSPPVRGEEGGGEGGGGRGGADSPRTPPPGTAHHGRTRLGPGPQVQTSPAAKKYRKL